MKHQLMQLPYNSLAPLMSDETLEYHHAKHHQAYVDNLNSLIVGTKFEQMSLEEIIKNSDGAIFNNAAQVFNHDFFWNGLTPTQGGIPSVVSDLISKAFGSIERFKGEFSAKAMAHFGSGWVWLVVNRSNMLEIIATSNAGCPIGMDLIPILTCDVWEHAYYIDTRNLRAKYLDNFWQLVNWDFVAGNLIGAGL